ncbi:hypothetical protein KJ815_00545, partial [bacterium]|nr:hypothetical protein [bacterium]
IEDLGGRQVIVFSNGQIRDLRQRTVFAAGRSKTCGYGQRVFRARRAVPQPELCDCVYERRAATQGRPYK